MSTGFALLGLFRIILRGFLCRAVDSESIRKLNGGFFVLSPKVLDYISGPFCIWEKEPLENLAKHNELKAFVHTGFWQPMDTLRDKNYLENLWSINEAPWRKWKNA